MGAFANSFSSSFSKVIFFGQQPQHGHGKARPLSQSLLHLAEIADVSFPLKENELRLLTTVSCIGSDGNRRGRTPRGSSSSSGRTSKNNEDNEKSANSASQEEIIAIFRRIQSSISKEENSAGYDLRDSDVSDKNSPASSILKALRESGKNQGRSKTEEESKTLTRKRSVPKKYVEFEDNHSPLTLEDSNLTRPVSNFVRRSPIPSPTPLRGVCIDLNNVIPSTIVGEEELQLPKVEGMKLFELKELAKSRGIKGYSKLKKSELISLLRP